ncbi:MAG: FAD-dependent oxidoreductase [Acidobacteria bacterium]|nr:FAD-dependent oxidoreductase [Acidobacteriota bacterium]
MAEQQLQTDICIIGAGPAGLAAAAASLTGEQRVTVIDENHSLGGQIWRAEIGRGAHPCRDFVKIYFLTEKAVVSIPKKV